MRDFPHPVRMLRITTTSRACYRCFRSLGEPPRARECRDGRFALLLLRKEVLIEPPVRHYWEALGGKCVAHRGPFIPREPRATYSTGERIGTTNHLDPEIRHHLLQPNWRMRDIPTFDFIGALEKHSDGRASSGCAQHRRWTGRSVNCEAEAPNESAPSKRQWPRRRTRL
jgi:hypothetical protein